MRTAIGSLLLLGACTSGPVTPLVETYERDCIAAIAAGGVLHGTDADALVVTYGCAGQPSRMDIVALDEAGLTARHGVGFDGPVREARVLELDGAAPAEVVALADDGFGYAAWFSGPTSPPRTTAYGRAFAGLATADLDLDTIPDVIVAGDGEIRVALAEDPRATPVVLPGDEATLFGTWGVEGAADIVDVGTRPGVLLHQLVYVATTPTGAYQLGILLENAYQPMSYYLAQTMPLPPGPRLPLVMADVEGDGTLDAIGATGNVFVLGSASGGVATLAEGALAIDAGRFYEPHDEAVFLARDGRSIKRVFAAGAALGASEQVLLDEEARAFAVGDLDGNGVDDFAVVHGRLGQPGTRVRVHFN